MRPTNFHLAGSSRVGPFGDALRAGFLRTARDYVDSLYKKIPGADKQVDIRDVHKVKVDDAPPDAATAGDEGAAFRASVGAAVKDRGIALNEVQIEAGRLFDGPMGETVLDLFDTRTLDGLAPMAEVDAHVQMASYLSDLFKLRTGAAPDAPHVPQEAFAAQYDAALRGKGIDSAILN